MRRHWPKDPRGNLRFAGGILTFLEFRPQSSSACAFKWDLKAKEDESKGGLLPIHGILLFFNQNEHPRVDFGSAETRFWSTFGAPSALRMHNDTAVFLRKSEASIYLGHKTAVHVHSSGS